MKEVVTLDLFSGIGGFSKGFVDAGMSIRTHYYSEIDKHAIAIYKYQFPNSQYVGSVTTLDGRAITRPNIITFGSPCQDFSVAGKRAGLEGQRSSLIGEAIRLIAECRPDVFIWENVKGVFSSNNGEDFWAVIQAFTNIGGYRLEWQLLNTAWFLPQNRERIYLVGHLAESGRDFKGIFPIGYSNQLSEQGAGETGGGSGELCSTVTSNLKRGVYAGGKTYVKIGTLRTHNDGKGFREVESGLAPTILARAREDGSGQPVIVAQRGRENGQQLEPSRGDYTNTLTGVQKDNLVIVGNIYESGGQNGNVYDTNGISPSISSGETSTRGNGGIGSSNAPKIMEDFYSDRIREFDECPTLRGDRHGLKVANTVTPDAYLTKGERNRDENGKAILTSMNERRIRRLTEIECERLQGFPDNWTEYGDYDGVIKKVPKTQRYKALGNAVTVAVVKEIAKLLIEEL